MKKILLSKLRDKNCSREVFRHATQEISDLLALEAVSYLPRAEISVETPITKTTGEKLLSEQVVLPILRAGLAMLPSFLRILPNAKIGFLGLKRDEKTFQAKLYYENLPHFNQNDDVLIIDPMLATGGSAKVVVERLREQGVNLKKLIFVGIVASPEGMDVIQKLVPEAKIIVGAIDEGLNENKFIVPGLGDFGDRYFGTD